MGTGGKILFGVILIGAGVGGYLLYKKYKPTLSGGSTGGTSNKNTPNPKAINIYAKADHTSIASSPNKNSIIGYVKAGEFVGELVGYPMPGLLKVRVLKYYDKNTNKEVLYNEDAFVLQSQITKK